VPKIGRFGQQIRSTWKVIKCGAEILSEIIAVFDAPTVSYSGHASERHVSSTDIVMSLRILVGTNRVCCLYNSGSRLKCGKY
jgi:hypothetical protein